MLYLNLFQELGLYTACMLCIAILFVLLYEFINGFHDTANAVVTVIYTKALPPNLAVIFSGFFNFLGVILGGLSVAYTIVHLLPSSLLLNTSSINGLKMMFSILLAAIMWNFGTWYFRLPVSSSHTLIGAIIGVGLSSQIFTNTSINQNLNISKLYEVFFSLIISPIIGFLISGTFIIILRKIWKDKKINKKIHFTPSETEKIYGNKKPPFWIRVSLIFSAASISFSHGANDGQKGIGLIMLILIGVFPAGFVINMDTNSYNINTSRNAINNVYEYFSKNKNILFNLIENKEEKKFLKEKKINDLNSFIPNKYKNKFCISENIEDTFCKSVNVFIIIKYTSDLLSEKDNFYQLSSDQRFYLRKLILYISDIINETIHLPNISNEDKKFLKNLNKDIIYIVEYSPIWITIIIALSLACGTIISWKRVAQTIGEKIGKREMTYAQSLSAQFTSALSIGIASYTGMPVSTTHVLSSAVAGAVLTDHGEIQWKTVKNILMAWILTLPITMVLSGILYISIYKI
ncbi:pitA [Wigglesworthia glossinidia endosymbiont of Glossina brevipalpis]|uniref:Phosphate transporter n=1 Tax=Wigglesworthia glossinidia brevipalpis TaxID=36870 RepID=Q8D366_WIGBR|nr:pitA [Wigglesworthia glossinidia endosymbiont of Glossina brevipalpis]